MKLLITGAGGMLGQDVVRAAQLANHEVVGLDRALLDVTDAELVRDVVQTVAPHVVVNCAAYTDVDGAEDHPDDALRVNADGARALSAAAAELGAAIVYPSTDYVFDGRKDSPYVETDDTNPLSSYGASKLAGEIDTAAVNQRNFIVRTSWLFGTAGRNFVETMLELASAQPQVLVVRDQTGTPTYTAHLAEGIVRLLATGAYGTHHMSARGSCSWYEFATAIFEDAEVECSVLSTTTAEMGRPAPRPEYSVLETAWQHAIHLPEWRVGLRSYLKERS